MANLIKKSKQEKSNLKPYTEKDNSQELLNVNKLLIHNLTVISF